ncbi:hypothetical protein EJ065_1817 [Corallococcus coralloides]|uniref:AbiJ-NTD3 domain-containing protein n=2 Tax=Corallococcus coralloides TaxID=184914 RepID=A0A410RNI7_CORCK|nr:hypothetical protein EJ065_1817 [Corallococcus coralloides]
MAREQSIEFTELARRNIVATLEALPAPWGQLDADEVIGRVIPLGEGLLSASLSEPEVQDVKEACEQYGLLKASGRRFRQFIERMVHPSVRNEEEQKRYVGALNVELRKSDWELRVSDSDAGRALYSVERVNGGVGGRPKQIIFASNVKPDLRFSDAINGDIEIVRFADRVLVYDRPIPSTGLLWNDLQEWWAAHNGLPPQERATSKHLYLRLRESLPTNSPPQRLLFDTYFRAYSRSFGGLPALLPEVWLYYDPVTVERRGRDALFRQRMDFLMLFSRRVRVVLEVDGIDHYADKGRASAAKYAEMVAADRDLRLAGYEVYRFGGGELQGSRGVAVVKGFFRLLFQRHGVEAVESS